MYLEEKRLVNNKKYNSKHNTSLADSFIILDDKTTIIDNNIKKIFKEIEKYNYEINICDIKEISNKTLTKYANEIKQFDTIITTGTGGKLVYESIKDNDLIKNKEVYFIKWNRIWKDKCYFDTNIDELNISNKKILILEDVIASGKTMYNLITKLKEKNEVVGILNILIQESSPLSKKSFVNIYSGAMIKCLNKELDPYWFPPIYSLRHLLYGDDEVANFYDTLNNKYFNAEKNVEEIIKSVRGEL